MTKPNTPLIVKKSFWTSKTPATVYAKVYMSRQEYKIAVS
jgi:hypothetical protein